MRFRAERPRKYLVWCLRNSYTFVALKLASGKARGRECIRSDTRPTEQRSPRPISAQPRGRPVFWAEALLLAPYRSTAGYARRSRLASAQNPLPRMYSYFGDTTPGKTVFPKVLNLAARLIEVRRAAGTARPRKTRKVCYETIETFFPIVECFVFRSFNEKGQAGVCFRCSVDWSWDVAAGRRATGRFQ